MNKPNGDMERLRRTAEDDLFRYPHATWQGRIKSGLVNTSNALRGRPLATVDRYSWPNAMLAASLIAGANGTDARSVETVKAYFDSWLRDGMRMHYLDNAMNGVVAISLCGESVTNEYGKAASRIANYLYRHPTDRFGSLPYRPEYSGDVYVDSLGMICPFLSRYAVRFDEDAAGRLCVRQIENFLRFGMDESTGLPYHGYDPQTGIKKGIVGWGRGVGWLLGGMVGTLEEPSLKLATARLRDEFVALVETSLKLQLDDGRFAWQLTAHAGPVDISATSMILLAVGKGISLGLLDNTAARASFNRGMDGVRLSIVQGMVQDCSAECGGFGVYPQIYSSYPWGLAPTLSLQSEFDC